MYVIFTFHVRFARPKFYLKSFHISSQSFLLLSSLSHLGAMDMNKEVIFRCCWRVGLPKRIFSSNLSIKPLYASVVSPIRTTCGACLVFLDLTTLIAIFTYSMEQSPSRG